MGKHIRENAKRIYKINNTRFGILPIAMYSNV